MWAVTLNTHITAVESIDCCCCCCCCCWWWWWLQGFYISLKLLNFWNFIFKTWEVLGIIKIVDSLWNVYVNSLKVFAGETSVDYEMYLYSHCVVTYHKDDHGRPLGKYCKVLVCISSYSKTLSRRIICALFSRRPRGPRWQVRINHGAQRETCHGTAPPP